MKMNIENQHHQTFEDIKQSDNMGNEFWYARALSKTLGYAEFRNFQPVIEKAKLACINSQQAVDDHFVQVHEEIIHGKGAIKAYESFALLRYACYLVRNTEQVKTLKV
jgi:DNA-damage-inducible protein D